MNFVTLIPKGGFEDDHWRRIFLNNQTHEFLRYRDRSKKNLNIDVISFHAPKSLPSLSVPLSKLKNILSYINEQWSDVLLDNIYRSEGTDDNRNDYDIPLWAMKYSFPLRNNEYNSKLPFDLKTDETNDWTFLRSSCRQSFKNPSILQHVFLRLQITQYALSYIINNNENNENNYTNMKRAIFEAPAAGWVHIIFAFILDASLMPNKNMDFLIVMLNYATTTFYIEIVLQIILYLAQDLSFYRKDDMSVKICQEILSWVILKCASSSSSSSSLPSSSLASDNQINFCQAGGIEFIKVPFASSTPFTRPQLVKIQKAYDKVENGDISEEEEEEEEEEEQEEEEEEEEEEENKKDTETNKKDMDTDNDNDKQSDHDIEFKDDNKATDINNCTEPIKSCTESPCDDGNDDKNTNNDREKIDMCTDTDIKAASVDNIDIDIDNTDVDEDEPLCKRSRYN